MVQDLNLNVALTGVPTVREETGLALSSRNVFLKPEDRTHKAPLIYQVLTQTKEALQKGNSAKESLHQGRMQLSGAGFTVQYFELRALKTLEDFSEQNGAPSAKEEWILACAAYLPSNDGGKVRLIDNLIF